MLEAQGMSTIKEGNFYKRRMIISQTSDEKHPKELQYTEHGHQLSKKRDIYETAEKTPQNTLKVTIKARKEYNWTISMRL